MRGDLQAEVGCDIAGWPILIAGEQGDGKIGEEQEPGGLLLFAEAFEQLVCAGEITAVAGGDDPGAGLCGFGCGEEGLRGIARQRAGRAGDR